MADAKYVLDLSDLVEGRKEIRRWSKANTDAIDIVSSRMRAMGDTSSVALSRAAREAKKMADQMRMSGKSTNRFGMVAQQVGYQVGDFFVQVQSGTNAMVAFGQQGTQLAGLLPGVAGAIVGISLSVGTTLVGAFMRMRAEAKESAEGVNELKGEIESLDKALKDWANTKKAVSMGVTAEELIGLGSIEQAEEDLKKATAALKEFSDKVTSPGYGAAGGIEPEFFKSFFNADAASKYEAAVKAVEAAEVRLQNLRLKQEEERSALFAEESSSLVRQAELQRTILKYGEDSVEVANKKAEQERVAYLAEQMRAGLSQEQIAALMKQYDALQNVTSEIERAEATTNKVANAVEGVSRALSTASSRAAVLANNLASAASAQSALNLAEKGVDAQAALAGSKAKLAALKSGQDELTASVKAYRAEREAQLGVSEAGSTAELDYMSAIINKEVKVFEASEKARIETEKNYKAIRELLSPKDADEGGAGGSSSSQGSNLQKLLAEMGQRKELLGLFGKELQLKKEIQRVTKTLGDEAKILTDGQIEGLARVNLELQRQEELKQQQIDNMQSVADTIKSSMSEAFMSMVEGTKSAKDAFRDMARAIIKQLFEVLVVQQLVGSFDVATGTGSGLAGAIMGAFANGAAFSGGKVTAFADGGVVSKPTLFPMANGAGLMGEAGPEAIMPLKRGKNGKLGVQMEGSQQPVVINQSFNFSANGDDSVKRIIAQAAPSIANMAKQSVIDARRRGGVMKNTFG